MSKFVAYDENDDAPIMLTKVVDRDELDKFVNHYFKKFKVFPNKAYIAADLFIQQKQKFFPLYNSQSQLRSDTARHDYSKFPVSTKDCEIWFYPSEYSKSFAHSEICIGSVKIEDRERQGWSLEIFSLSQEREGSTPVYVKYFSNQEEAVKQKYVILKSRGLSAWFNTGTLVRLQSSSFEMTVRKVFLSNNSTYMAECDWQSPNGETPRGSFPFSSLTSDEYENEQKILKEGSLPVAEDRIVLDKVYDRGYLDGLALSLLECQRPLIVYVSKELLLGHWNLYGSTVYNPGNNPLFISNHDANHVWLEIPTIAGILKIVYEYKELKDNSQAQPYEKITI